MRATTETTITLTLAALAVSALLALPVQARSHGPNRSQVVQIEMNNFSNEQSKLRSQISSALGTGRITRAQAAQITGQLDQLAAETNNAYASGALTDQLAWQFVDRFNQIQNELNMTPGNPSYMPAAQGAPSTPMNSYGYNAAPYANPYYGNSRNPYGLNPHGYPYF